MRMKREGEEEEVWWDWEKLKKKKNPKIKLFAQKSLNIKLFCKEI